jgi:hypothetical protein
MLAEFIATTGYHPKSALRVLNQQAAADEVRHRNRPLLYDEAARQSLIILWEASDRVCGKRLRPLLPVLLGAMERHGHMKLDTAVRDKILTMSAATIDRLLRSAKLPTKNRKPRSHPSAVRHQVPVRTFADWGDPDPGSMEMDLVAHNGGNARGSFVHTLVLTDIATGWTECAPLVVREGTLVVQTLDRVRVALPFPLRALDTDNGTEFINESLVGYCTERRIEFTRSRPWRKNDQAWIEQKNGAIVRKTVGDRRYEGIAAAHCLALLYTALRFFVNFFQTSFKLAGKTNGCSSVKRTYHVPATPCERLLSHPAIADATKMRLREVAAMLDPIRLLEEIRNLQTQLVAVAEGRGLEPPQVNDPDLSRFLSSLASAWQHGEVRPTHAVDGPPTYARVVMKNKPAPAGQHALPESTGPHVGRPAEPERIEIKVDAAAPKTATASPPVELRVVPSAQFDRRPMRMHAFVTVWPHVTRWLEACPNMNTSMILEQLQALYPGRFHPRQHSALHRRVRAWREVAVARGVVIGPRIHRVSPTHVWRRTRKDPFAADWPEILRQLQADPDKTAKDLFLTFCVKTPGRYVAGQLRTLQRRVKAWRADAVRKLVFDLETQPLSVGGVTMEVSTAPKNHGNENPTSVGNPSCTATVPSQIRAGAAAPCTPAHLC